MREATPARHAATFSLVVLVVAITSLVYVDRRNDADLIRADAENDAALITAAQEAIDRDAALDRALVRARCEQTAEARRSITLAFTYLGSYVTPEVRDPFLAWIARCIPQQDCIVTITDIPIPDDCETTFPDAPAESADG